MFGGLIEVGRMSLLHRGGLVRRSGAALLVLLAVAAPAAVMPQPVQARAVVDSYADLVEKLLPAVVNISTTQAAPEADKRRQEALPKLPPGSPFEEFFKDFFDRQQRGGGPAKPVTSLGSGFVIDPKGYVVTNNHVIADADQIKVILQDNTELPAKLIGKDPKTDLALLKVEPKSPLPSVKWGDSDKSRVGDGVIAIGNPFGLGGTVTAGIVSARGRNIRSGPYDDFIQTDASINKGNSGGPLFNINGEVIGINTAIFSQSGGSIGIGFALPANLAKPVVAQLMEFGRTKRGWLGVNIQSVTDEIAESLGLDKARGALVARVMDNGPAAQAKIEAGDVILSFDGKPVTNMNALPRIVAETPIGKKAAVEVWRGGKSRALTATVGELDESQDQVAAVAPTEQKAPTKSASEKSLDTLGLKMAPLSPELRSRFNLPDDARGVVVTEVTDGGPASQRDVQPGDLILELGQNEVKTPDDVIGRTKEAQGQKRRSVLVLLQRGADRRYLTIPFKG